MEDKTKQAYAKVIDLLMDGKVDYKAVCLRLAKEAPEAFAAMANESLPSPTNTLKNHMIKFIKANPGKKVEAIKEHRNLTGFGLKESKDYIDALTNEINDGLLNDLLGSTPVTPGLAAAFDKMYRPKPEYRDGGSF